MDLNDSYRTFFLQAGPREWPCPALPAGQLHAGGGSQAGRHWDWLPPSRTEPCALLVCWLILHVSIYSVCGTLNTFTSNPYKGGTRNPHLTDEETEVLWWELTQGLSSRAELQPQVSFISKPVLFKNK